MHLTRSNCDNEPEMGFNLRRRWVTLCEELKGRQFGLVGHAKAFPSSVKMAARAAANRSQTSSINRVVRVAALVVKPFPGCKGLEKGFLRVNDFNRWGIKGQATLWDSMG